MDFTPTSFCKHCSKIWFPALRTLSTSEIQDLLDGKLNGTTYASSGDGGTIIKVALGTLKRIKRDSVTCALCSIFSHVIRRQGAVYQANVSLDDDNIVFRPDPDSRYGNVTDSSKPDGANWHIRRLSLYGYSAKNLDNPVARFDSILQAYPVGAIVSTSRDPTTPDVGVEMPQMLFGGRQCPLVFDVKLIRGWTDICEHEHGTSFSMTKTQLQNSRQISFSSEYTFNVGLNTNHETASDWLTFV